MDPSRRLADEARGVSMSPTGADAAPRTSSSSSFSSSSRRLRMRQHGQHVSSGTEKSKAVIAVLIRILLSPLLFFVSMLLVEEKCCWDEPEGYQAPGWKRWLARRAKKGKSLRRALVRNTLRFLRALTSAAEALSIGRLQAQAAAAVVAARRNRRRRRRSSSTEGENTDDDDGNDDENENDDDENDDDANDDARLVLRRFAEAGRDSYTLTLQAVIYYATLHLLSFFAIERAIFAFRSDLERWVCRVGGVWHVTADGRRLPYTLPSAMDADFSTPGYNPGRGFPYGDGEGDEERRGNEGEANATANASTFAPSRIPFARPDDPRNAHFASLVCKAVYEDSAVVADLVRYKWRMRLAGHGRVPAHWTKSHWVPDLVWLVAESERGVILSFKGADPLWQVNLRADPPLSKRTREGVVGAVHCGLWRGLHQAAPGAAPGTSVADLILETLRQAGASSSSNSNLRSKQAQQSTFSSSSRPARRGGSAGGMRRRRNDSGEEEGAGSDDTAHSGGEDPPSSSSSSLPSSVPSPSTSSSSSSKPIFLCGHSLGGGLAALLAAVIAGKHPDLSARVAGVFTFAAPRFGDEEFAKNFSEVYRGRAFRYVHASDMVCKLPPGFGYGHHASERFITSFPTRKANASASGRILREEIDGAEVMNAVAKLEDRAAHAFHFAKLAVAASGMGGWFESSLVGGPLRWWWGKEARMNGGGGSAFSSLASAGSSSSSYSSSPRRARHGARHGGGGAGGGTENGDSQRQRQRRQQLLRPTPSSRLLTSVSSSHSRNPNSSSSTSSSSSTKGESRVRLALRWALLAVPGFSDHFLCEYERALRAEVVAAEADAAAEAEAAAGAALAASLMEMEMPIRNNNFSNSNGSNGRRSSMDVRRGQAEEAEVADAGGAGAAEAEEEPLSLSPRLPFPAPPAVRTSAFAAAAAPPPQPPPLSPYSASLRTAGSGSVTAALRVGVSSLTQQQRGQQPDSQQQQQQPKAVSPLAALIREQLSRAFPSFI